MRLNIGCGKDIRPGYLNIDIRGAEMTYDLNKLPYPFKDNSVKEIIAYHIIEHLDISTESFLLESQRILTPGGILKIKVPHHTNSAAFQPEHKHFYSYSYFNHLSGEYTHNLENKDVTLQVIYKRIKFHKGWNLPNYLFEPLFNKIPITYESTILSKIIPANEYEVILKK